MHGDEKTFADILDDIWHAKWVMLLCAVVGLGLALAWVMLATPYYKAEMIVSPANPMNGSEISPPTAGDDLFALRYLVQRMGVSNSSDFQYFENIFNGPQVAARLMQDPQIVNGIMQDVPFSFLPVRQSWQPEDVAAYFTRHIEIEPVSNSALRRLVYKHPDRGFAVYTLGRMHDIADSLIRERIRSEASERIAYLNDAIAKTNNPDHRRALTTLLLEQERLRMLVSIDQAYAATVVEPASAGTRPVWPDGVFLVAVFMLVGAFIGFIAHAPRR